MTVDLIKVKTKVQRALDAQFELYTWDKMIEDIEDLSYEEKIYAKEYLYPKVVSV